MHLANHFASMRLKPIMAFVLLSMLSFNSLLGVTGGFSVHMHHDLSFHLSLGGHADSETNPALDEEDAHHHHELKVTADIDPTVRGVNQWDNPELSLSVLKVTESVPDPWVIGSALSLTIPVSGRLQIEKLRANAEAHSKLTMVAEEEWQTLADLTKIWLEWSANRLRLEESERVIASLNVILNTTEKLAEAGELPRTESTLFKVKQASRMADVAQLRGKVDEQEKEIRALMGLSPSASIQLIPSFDILAPSESAKLEDSNASLSGYCANGYPSQNRSN